MTEEYYEQQDWDGDPPPYTEAELIELEEIYNGEADPS